MAKKKVTKRKTKKKTEDPAEVWEAFKEKLGSEEVFDYTMGGSYRVNTAIQHPKFGLGVVRDVLSNKIDVVFQDGARFLVHNRNI